MVLGGIRAQYRHVIGGFCREWYWGPIPIFPPPINAFIMDNQRPADIPTKLGHFIYLNVAYRVLICRHKKCRKAVEPRAFSEHLRVQHQTPLGDRECVQQYVSKFRWDYDYSTIQLPQDGSAPQPVIPVSMGSSAGSAHPNYPATGRA